MTRRQNATGSFIFERDDGTEVSVEYEVTPFDMGVTSGPAERCYPPEGGDVMVTAVKTLDGKPIAINALEDERALDEAKEDFAATGGDGMDEPPERDRYD